MRKLGPPPLGNVVAEYKFGGTTVKVCDDAYRDKTKEDIQAILDRIERIAWKCIEAKSAKEGAL